MRRLSTAIAVMLVASVAAAPIPYFQQLQEGNWTGTATDPEGMTIDVVYAVKSTDEGQQLTLQIPEIGMTVPAKELKLEDGKLTFTLSAETEELACVLERQESGSFEGECEDLSGGTGWLVMNPPAAAAD